MPSSSRFSFMSLPEISERLKGQVVYEGMCFFLEGSPFLLVTSHEILGVGYPQSQGDLTRFKKSLAQKYKLSSFLQDSQVIREWEEKIRAGGSLSFLVGGSSFQIQVWQFLSKLASGKTATYEEIAFALERPRALRAVGNAVGANPVSYFLPCHRILRKSGDLGGYRWGIPLKKRLLTEEGIF